jgi:hypothetical protein
MLLKSYVNKLGTAVVLVCAGCAFFNTAPGNVTIRNDANRTLRQVTIIVSDETLMIHDLKPGDQVRLSYTLNRESDYNVVATFADGGELKGRPRVCSSGAS